MVDPSGLRISPVFLFSIPDFDTSCFVLHPQLWWKHRCSGIVPVVCRGARQLVLCPSVDFGCFVPFCASVAMGYRSGWNTSGVASTAWRVKRSIGGSLLLPISIIQGYSRPFMLDHACVFCQIWFWAGYGMMDPWIPTQIRHPTILHLQITPSHNDAFYVNYTVYSINIYTVHNSYPTGKSSSEFVTLTAEEVEIIVNSHLLCCPERQNFEAAGRNAVGSYKPSCSM